MDFKLLAPIEQLDGDAAVERFVADYDPGMGDAGDALSDMVKTMVHISVDMTSVGLRKLALIARENELAFAGWTLRGVEGPDRWDLPMIIERNGAGFVINCQITPELTVDAQQKYDELRARRSMRLAAVKDSLSAQENATAKWKVRFSDKDPDEEALKAEAFSWKPISECRFVEEVNCVAFGSDGGMLDKYALGKFATLEAILAEGFRDAYHPTLVFEASPCQSFDRGYKPNPEIDISTRVANFGSALFALHVAGTFFKQAGLQDEVAARAAERARLQYTYIGEEDEAPSVIEAGAAAVPFGIVTFRSDMDLHDFWKATAAIDVRTGAQDHSDMIRLLRDHGHVSPEHEYECNADDHSWLDQKTDNTGILWIRGQNGQYRIDYTQDDAGKVTELAVARWREKEFDGEEVVNDLDPRFVASFKQEEGRMVPSRFAIHTMRKVRDLDNVLFAMRSIPCCLAEDYKNDGYQR